MKEVVVYTQAYNAEKTLHRAINSVLAQNFGEYKVMYYLIDNGSTDSTGMIIEEYASKYNWIIPIYIKVNTIGTLPKRYCEIAGNHFGEGYFFHLDADDYYESQFFEKTSRFMEEYGLDVAACNVTFFDANTEKGLTVRTLGKDLLINSVAKFGEYFPNYHWFIRAPWAKLFKLDVFRKANYDRLGQLGLSYGGDTTIVLEMLRHARQFGVLNVPLYRYQVSKKSVSHKWLPHRVLDDSVLLEDAEQFLCEKTGTVSQANKHFLLLVYFYAIKDTQQVVLNAQISPIEKMQAIKEIYTCKHTQELLHRNFSDIHNEMNELRGIVLKWIFEQRECLRGAGAEGAVETIRAMYGDLLKMVSQDSLTYIIAGMPEMVEYLLQKDYTWVLEHLRTWGKRHNADIPGLTELEISLYYTLERSEDEFFTFLTEIKRKRPQSAEVLDIDRHINKLVKKYPLMANLSNNLVILLSRTIIWVLRDNLSRALGEFIKASQSLEIADDDVEAYILFGQNLSASVENADAYLYFKKIWISYLLNYSRREEAGQELDELRQLLPDDEDFAALHQRMIN